MPKPIERTWCDIFWSDTTYNITFIWFGTGYIYELRFKKIETAFIQHEISNAAKDAQNKELIKVIFHHQCRGDANFDTDADGANKQRTGNRTRNTYEATVNTCSEIEMQPITQVHAMEKEEQKCTGSTEDTNSGEYDANWITIYGTVSGRTISDSGKFTDCICESFRDNVGRRWKKNFGTLVREIGVNLQRKTEGAELCEQKSILRHEQIRFERNKSKLLCEGNTEQQVMMDEEGLYLSDNG
eukprot:196704_1